MLKSSQRNLRTKSCARFLSFLPSCYFFFLFCFVSISHLDFIWLFISISMIQFPNILSDYHLFAIWKMSSSLLSSSPRLKCVKFKSNGNDLHLSIIIFKRLCAAIRVGLSSLFNHFFSSSTHSMICSHKQIINL